MDLVTPVIWLLMLVDTMAGMEERERERDRNRKRPSVEKIVSELLNKRRYAKSDPPRFDKPTKVELGIYVNSFYSISEQTMDYMVSMYLRQAWQDSRLGFEPLSNGVTKIRLGEGSWDKLWVPDTFFRNEKGAHFHIVTVKNRLMTLNSSGHLWYATKISATLSCPMKLHKYPLDTQHCPMMFESFGYTMDTMYFAWLPSPVDIDPNVQLPQFTLKDEILYDCSQNYTAGAFPCLQISFILQRDIGFFLIQVYVPTILIVILSWVSFWINVDAIPARVSLGLLTVLTMTTMSTGANSTLPRVSYVKAIDVWMSTCLVFVFAALLEFAVVNVISRKGVRMKPSRQAQPAIQQFQLRHPGISDQKRDSSGLLGCFNSNVVENGRERRATSTLLRPDVEGKSKARQIDKVSRKAFPMAFLLFNIVYWIIYTLPDDDPESLG